MTIVKDRTNIEPPAPIPPSPVERSISPTASWRFAARLARREVRRRPGRTLLVMLLVAVPVIGTTVGSIAMRTTNESVAVQYVRQFGSSDLTFQSGSGVVFDDVNGSFVVSNVTRSNLGDDPGFGQVDTAPPRSYTFPAGPRAITTYSVSSPVRGIDANGRNQRPFVQIVDVDPTDPLAAGL